MPFVSSDPDAWMRPYYEAIASREGFGRLSIPIQFATLVNAIAEDHPAKAAKLREIDDPTPGGHLGIHDAHRLSSTRSNSGES